MDVIVKFDQYKNVSEMYELGEWCIQEFGYLPEMQGSRIAQCFKLRSDEDAMAFKLRWE